MPEIKAESVSFSYRGKRVLDDISFHLEGPSFIALLGRNGSGKSTLMRLIDGLLPLQEGNIAVDGLPLRDEASLPEIRRHIGFLFQDPDNQFVSPVLDEDVAFGPENYGLPESEVERRVRSSLERTGMLSFRKRSPHILSGGEKEKAALSGVLALDPDILISDESLSMLDPVSHREMFSLLRDAGKESLIVMITHSAEDAAEADRVLLLSEGHIAADGKPEDVLADVPLLESAGIRPPFPVRLSSALRERGIDAGMNLSPEKLGERILSLLEAGC